MSDEKSDMDGNAAFSTIMNELWNAEQSNRGAYFTASPNTPKHFLVTATAELDGRTAQCKRIWAYAELEAAQYPAVLLRERLNYMAYQVFNEVDPM